ncbi:transposase, partial [Nocardia elegans]
MAKGFRPVDRDQQFLLAPDMRQWLGADDPVWLVISVVERLDTSVLRARRRVGGVGRAGYDPDMLLTLLVWAWAQGQRSSRVIERLCSRDVAFRVICAGDVPDHSTISRFRAEAAEAVEGLFAQVLRLCAGWGMGELGVVALDGVKIASNASISANRGEQGLRKAAAEQGVRDAAAAAARRAAAEHAATDAAEDELYGVGRRGGEVPSDLVEPSSRARRIDQALAELAAENTRREREQADKQAGAERKQARRTRKAAARAAQLEAFEQRRLPGRSVTGGPPAEIRVQVLTRNWEAARAAQQAKIDRYEQRGIRRGRRPAAVDDHAMVKRVRAALDRAIATEQNRTEHSAAPTARTSPTLDPTAPAPAQPAHSWAGTPKRNITDPESRLMPLRGGGWLQGFNCQAVTSTDGLIIATDVGNNPNDATTFTSMLDKATAAAQLITGARAQTTHAPTGP